MESVQLFLKEVTDELLYNIVYDADEIDYRDLSEEFEVKTGHRPMDFFGFGNITGSGWFDFVQGIPGVEGKKKISIICDSDENSSDEDSEDEVAYKIFNTTCLYENIVRLFGIGEIVVSFSVANYREMLLIRCCEIMKDHFADLSDWEDVNGNTPLHFIAALPGVKNDCRTLVKYLLEAGVDPLAVNNDGQTFLHIIFGRFKAENDYGALCFKNERIAKTKWFVQDRVALLELLSEELLQKETALLAKVQDKNGNTVLHECALSTAQQEFIEEDKICKKLLKFGASLKIPNNSGQVPLHYAHNSSLFKIFLQNGAVCRERSDRDETPVLFILKKSADLTFAQTSATAELVDQGFVKTGSSRSIQKVVQLLENLTDIVSENEEARKTVWIPDIEGNVAIDIALIAIRIASYNVYIHSRYITDLRSSLVELLREMLRNAAPSDMNRQNKKGQSFLHVLLDMGDGNKHKIIQEAYILQSLQILLDHHADVNAVDFQGRTPRDITLKHLNKGPSLYKKCADLLIKHGATGKRDTGNNSYSTTSSNQSTPQSSLLRKMSNLRIHNETRKIRSCPKRHLKNAQRLTNPNTQVTVVEKYRYSNQVPIGTGTFSSVFVAIKDENVDSRSGTIECRAYALKRLDKSKINPQEIKREITTLLSISGQCDNIIKCHEAVDDSFFQYLDLMDGDLHEFVVNDDVNKVMKSNPAICVQVAKEIINGLAFLHEKRFIHRDLKPGNILYTTDPTLHFKITDFGLTKNMSTLSTMTSTRGSGVAMAPGTRCWMAPELVSMKSREHTQQSDIFSLGLVLYYLLTLGKHPFATGSEEPPHVIERKIVDMRISLDRALRPEATSLLQVLLTKDPSKRPPATYLNQHPFLWSESKKIEFLKAVGDQPEAVNPGIYVNSALEQRLQKTHTAYGQHAKGVSWDWAIEELYEEMTKAWKQKKYRTDKVIDLIRFIRNAYAHKQEKSFQTQQYLDENIFLRVYPSLVLDVFGVVQELGFEEHRSNICQALSLNT